MKIAKTLFVAALLVAGMACGYSSKATTPAVAGTMPAITQLNPNSATHGDPQFTLTVTGSNFNGNAVINFSGTAMSSSPVSGFSGTEVQASIPASAIMNAGSVQVTVTNPGTAGGQYGGGTAAETSNMMTFTVN
jgi:hypothetical protein